MDMYRLSGPGCFILSLVLSLPAQISDGSQRNRVLADEGKPPHLVSVQTYSPSDFQESLLDRLSGGLAQHLAYRMAVDSRGRILVTDPGLGAVHVFDTWEGKRYQISGDRHHRLLRPTYIAVDDDDNIYLTDSQLSAVVVLRPNGQLKRIIGSGVFDVPAGICIDSKNRVLYAADWWKGEILLFDLEGRLLRSFGSRGSGTGQLKWPRDIALHDNTLFVLDHGNSRFVLFDSLGNFHAIWPFGANGRPLAFAFDAVGHLYYVDLYSGGLVAMDTNGRVVTGFDQRPFGQWMPRSASQPHFTCVAQDLVRNGILVLRPTFKMQALTLVTTAQTDDNIQPL
jgi:DNA-binding beta-propeller fold protein YncE